MSRMSSPNSVVLLQSRYYFLDVLRSLALIEMMHGHTLDALLAGHLRNTYFYSGLQFFRGITAPLFLYIAGFCFGLGIFGRKPVMSRTTSKIWRRFRRIFTIIIAGYLLYLPFFSLIKTIQHINTPAWQTFIQTDILRCIGIMLLILLLITFFRPGRLWFYVIFGALTLCLPAFHTLIKNSVFISSLPDFIRYYITGSPFPLIYYGAYVTLGFVCCRFFYEHRQHWHWLVGITGVVILGLAIFQSLIIPDNSFGKFAFISAFIILLVLAVSRLESWWQKMPVLLKFFGQESLFIYIAHLLIVYGSCYNRGLRFYVGPNLSWPASYTVVLILVATMMISAYGLHRMRIDRPRLLNWLRYGFYIVFFLILVFRQY